MNDKENTASRILFEKWIGAFPYERDLYRWPLDETNHAWPGQYKDVNVELAWQAWREALTVVNMELVVGIQALFKLMDDEDLVRNTDNDADFMKFTDQSVRIANALALCKDAMAKAKAG